MTVHLTLDADEDIAAIIDYSISEFGIEQAGRYYEGLKRRFDSILNGTAYVTDYSFVRDGLMRVNYESHAIYYKKIAEDEILIMRILHQQMNELRHLKLM